MASPSDDSSKRKHAESVEKCGALEDNKRGGSNEHRRRSYSREDTPPAPCSVLCGPRSCSTLPSTLYQANECGTSPPEPKRRRLWGLRGLVKMFRRRVRRKGGDDPSGSPQGPPSTLRTRSASEIAVDPCIRSNSGPYNQGLSVSHDSVFSPESPTEQSHNVPPSLALATRGVNMSELKAALRRRRDDSGSRDDDPGLPRSPQTSPTTLDVLNHELKSYSRTTQSTCSDGSLLSMGSSENDEDSFGALSNHSSRASLFESRYQVVDHEPAAGIVHLSHKAAMHKISVRPKRSHAIPHARRKAQALPLSLPTTPEVNEDSSIRKGYSESVSSNKSSTPSSVLTRHSTSSVSSKAHHHSSKKESKSELHESARKTVSSFAAFKREEREERKEDTQVISPSLSSGYSNQHKEMKEDDLDEEKQVASFVNSSFEVKNLAKEETEIFEETFEFDDSRRVLGEKRKDPFRSSAGSKSSRQKSDPSRLSNREDEEVKESEREDKNGSCRSASVEGRLEGHLFEEISMSRRSYVSAVSTHQAIKDVLTRGRQSRQEEFHRERMEIAQVEEPIRHKSSVDYPEFIMKERQESIANRLSSSYECLERDEVSKDDITKKEQTYSNNSLDSCESNASTLGGRSSTDSLTTTPLLGIYIRSSQSKPSRSSHGNPNLQIRPNFNMSPKWKDDDMEVSSGPLSLDSSLTVVHISQQDEETIRKALSVDEVGGGKGNKSGSNSSRRSLGSAMSVDQTHSSRSASVFRSVSVHSPGSTMSSNRSRKSSLGDELESDSSLPRVSLRPVKREASLKKPKIESEPGTVPEFMRIQLNRVENKANTVIFDTDNEQLLKSVSKTPPAIVSTKVPLVVSADSEKPKKVAVIRKDEFEQSRESSEMVVEDRIAVKTTQLKPENEVSNQTSENFLIKPTESTIKLLQESISNVINEPKDMSPVVPNNPPEEPLKEEIILRRPSVMDRSAVLDQVVSESQSSQATLPNKQDQPELLKVFARRSFKLKDVELEEAQGDLEHEFELKKNQLVEQTSVLKDAPKVVNVSPLTKDKELVKNLPTLRSISSKRYSVGSNISSISKSSETKPEVIVLSVNARNESEPHVVKQDIRSRNPESHIPYNRSQSLTPSPKTDFQGKKPANICSSESTASSGSDVDDPVGQARKDSRYFSRPISTPSRVNPLLDSSMSNGFSNSKSEGPVESPLFSSAIVKRSATANFNNSPSNAISTKTTTPIPIALKPAATRVQSVIWPPRSQPNESKTDSTESLEVATAGSSPVAPALSCTPPPRSSLPASRILSSFSESFGSVASNNETPKKEENSAAVTRRRLVSVSSGNPLTSVSEPNETSLPIFAEARNTSVAHTFDSQSSIGLTIAGSKTSPIHALKNEKLDEELAQSYQSHRNSIGANEDWRVLVRQRREDRMKQTKTQDDEEIIIETRPIVSRNSKVLEMASNFQKLQVA